MTHQVNMEHDIESLWRQVNLVKKARIQLKAVPPAQVLHVSDVRFDCGHGIPGDMSGT
jgi:hypothetical protein